MLYTPKGLDMSTLGEQLAIITKAASIIEGLGDHTLSATSWLDMAIDELEFLIEEE